MRLFAANAMLAAFLAALSTKAAAADCAQPPAPIATIALESDIDRREFFVPVTIEGVAKLMLLDTGGAMTEITTEAADELHLSKRRGRFQLFNMYGEFSDRYAEAMLGLGPMKPVPEDLAIAPGENNFGDDRTIAGVLAPDILHHYDLDIDFGASHLALYPASSCQGPIGAWHADSISIIPIHVLRSGQIAVDVLLDGKPVIAILDTGAHKTTLTLPIAETVFGLKLGGADTPRSGALSGLPNATTYRHIFPTLSMGGLTIANPQVEIVPDLLHQVIADATLPPTGSRLGKGRGSGDAKMLIGMNILSQFHLYIAYREEKLYVTAASPIPQQ
jgi:predicted aspartyl protease